MWVGNSKICKEGKNPIYEPAESQEGSAVVYSSTDNTYAPLVNNGAAQSDNPLYGVADISGSHDYAEPNSTRQKVVYDEPDVQV